MMEPDFNKGGGLVPAIVQDHATGEVLMLAYMNREAWQHTLSTGKATYWSRSRNTLDERRDFGSRAAGQGN